MVLSFRGHALKKTDSHLEKPSSALYIARVLVMFVRPSPPSFWNGDWLHLVQTITAAPSSGEQWSYYVQKTLLCGLP